MNNKALTLSVVMALLAVFFVQSYVTSIEDEAKKKFGTEVIVVKAKRDISEQQTINETMIEFDAIPKKFLEPASIWFPESENEKEKEKQKEKRTNEIRGMVAVVPIKKGEQITGNKVTEPGIRTGLAPQVTPGRRAIAIPVTETSGVAKLVKPGDRVDLIAIMDLGGGKENRIAKMVLQDVVVLAVGRNVTNNAARLVETDPYSGKEKVRSLSEDSSFATVTLEVEPAQAQTLALIMSNGDNALTMALRNNDDTERVSVGAAAMSDVLGTDAGRVQRVPAGRK